MFSIPRSPIALFLLVTAGAVAVSGQGDDPTPTFDVVSIRPNQSSSVNDRLELQPGGRIIWMGTTLRHLIGVSHQRWAFDNREIIGGPEWIDRERFDVIAQASGPLTVDATGFPSRPFAMIRAMLADRFALEVHDEQRERPVYELVATASQLGRQLRRSQVDCVSEMAEQAKGKKATRLPNGRVACVLGGPPGGFSGTGLGIAQLAAGLASVVGRPVIDRTGLTGAFDWDVEFRPELVQPIGNEPPPPPDAFADRPSIFTALQEQLGLRLESARAPVDVLVVDSASRPTPD